MRAAMTVGALVLAAVGRVAAGDVPDFGALPARPVKEPAYVAKQPRYGRAVFGPRGDKLVWMVLDKGHTEGKEHDVLYIDLNADGDLTGAGERLTAAKGERFRLKELTDPATGVRHEDFTLAPRGTEPTVMLGLKWRGQYRFGGGYPEDPDAGGYMRFTARPEESPVVWLHGDGPFRFQRWLGGKLPVGGQADLKVFLGQPGRGPSSFAAAQEHILSAGEFVKAMLICRDGMGKELRQACELRERC